MKKIILISLLLLTGCATTTDYVAGIKEVKIPIPTKCDIVMPDKNIYLSDSIKEGDDIFEKMKSLLIDKKTSKTKEEELRSLLEVCIK